jgi:uncharacterized protein (DUF1501 family)
MLTRRKLLQRLSLGVLASGLPTISLARANTDVRFVLFILRGAVDGLALAAPYGDGNYRGLRGELALDTPGGDEGLLKLDGLFGLHPSLRNTHQFFRDGEALLVHAVASPYRERSHFDGQDVLENGSDEAGFVRDGWLNRAIGPLAGSPGKESAIALAQNTPLVLRGDNSVTSWMPSRLPGTSEDTLRRIERLYANDDFFSTRLRQALNSQAIAGDMGSMLDDRRNNELAQWKTIAAAAAKFLSAPDGPRIAVLEAGGWDTHANQGAQAGYLANRLAALDDALASLRHGLGEDWSNTVVAVVTEFGRTVSVNGTRGTDHGTAGAALLLGGAIDGGRVIADWPGIGKKDLFEGRDLYPTTDLRSVFKGILLDHLQLPEAHVANQVFPGSSTARPTEGLIRT